MLRKQIDMERKNLADLIEAIQTINPDSRENIELFTKAFFNAIIRGLHKDRFVKIKGLGTFKLIDVSSRESVDVNTGQRIEISGHSKITFTPDQSIKDAVNKPFAHLQAVVINEGTDVSQMGLADGKAVEDIRMKMEAENSDEQSGEEVTVVEPEVSVVEPEVADVGETIEAAGQDIAAEETVSAVELEQEDENIQTEEGSAATEEESTSTEVGSVANETGCDNEDAVEDAAEPGTGYDEAGSGYEDEAEQPVCVSKREKFFGLWLALTAVVCLAIGYVAGNGDVLSLRTVKTEKGKAETSVSVKPVKAAPAKVVSEKKDSVSAQPQMPEKKKEVAVKKPVMPVMPGDKFAIVGQKGEHVLGAGENITRLAKQIYGSKDCAKYIIRYNDISDPDLITIGTKLKLPDLQPVVKNVDF